MKNNPKYLVRPSDFMVWEHVTGTKCYRPLNNLRYADGSKYDHYYDFHTYDILTNDRNKFFVIQEDEVKFYQDKCDVYYKSILTKEE